MRNAVLASLVLLVTAACGDDASTTNEPATPDAATKLDAATPDAATPDAASAADAATAGDASSSTDAATSDASPPDEQEQVWVLQTRVYTPEGATGYAIPVAELSGDIDNKQGIEQAGGGFIYANPSKRDGTFLLTTAEEGAAVRYEVSETRDFTPGKKLSLEGEGVQHGFGTVAWVDDTTAYWFDSALLQVIHIDPSSMEIKNVFPIKDVERDGYRAWFSDRPAIREDGVFVTMNWSADWEDGTAIDAPKGSTLVHIDPKTDNVTVTSDERCTSMLSSITTPDGDAYFFSNFENAYVRIATGGDKGVPSCALRVRKGETTFDPDWELDVSERVGGRPADGILPGKGSTMWLRVFHADELDTQPTAFDAIDTAQAWQWYKLDFSKEDPAVKNNDRPYSSHGTAGLVVQGRSFFMAPNDDYTESDLVELVGDKLVKQATVVGELNTLIRAR
jgi:hypothetical protein